MLIQLFIVGVAKVWHYFHSAWHHLRLKQSQNFVVFHTGFIIVQLHKNKMIKTPVTFQIIQLRLVSTSFLANTNSLVQAASGPAQTRFRRPLLDPNGLGANFAVMPGS